MDGVVSPKTAGLIGSSAGSACSTSRGSGSRYEDADAKLDEIRRRSQGAATRVMQEIYGAVKPELIARRIEEIKAKGAVVCGWPTPQKVTQYYDASPRPDILVIQGTGDLGRARLDQTEPLNLKEFIAAPETLRLAAAPTTQGSI